MIKNINQIKERYLKEPLNMKLGHLASDLVRISTFSDRNVVNDLIEESKFFIEWVAPDTTFDTQVVLCDIQLNLALWQLRLLKVTDLNKLQTDAKKWSEYLLETSGLLAV